MWPEKVYGNFCLDNGFGNHLKEPIDVIFGIKMDDTFKLSNKSFCDWYTDPKKVEYYNGLFYMHFCFELKRNYLFCKWENQELIRSILFKELKTFEKIKGLSFNYNFGKFNHEWRIKY